MKIQYDKYGHLIEEKARVCYVPAHAHDAIDHADIEWGYISSWNESLIFVKFDRSLKKFGWEGTTAQSCLPQDLIISPSVPKYVEQPAASER